jgi:hypothetical protein
VSNNFANRVSFNLTSSNNLYQDCNNSTYPYQEHQQQGQQSFYDTGFLCDYSNRRSGRRNRHHSHNDYWWYETHQAYDWQQEQTGGNNYYNRYQQHPAGGRSARSSSGNNNYNYVRNSFHHHNSSMDNSWRSANNSGNSSSWRETSSGAAITTSDGHRAHNDNNSSSSSSSWAQNNRGPNNNHNSQSNSRRRNNYNWGNNSWHSYGRGSYKSKRQRKDESNSPKNKTKASFPMLTEEELALKLAEISGPAHEDRTKCDDAIDPISQARIWDDDFVDEEDHLLDAGCDADEFGFSEEDRSTRLPSSFSERTASTSSSSTAQHSAFFGNRDRRDTVTSTSYNEEDDEENDQNVQNTSLHHRRSCLLFPGSSSNEEEEFSRKNGSICSQDVSRTTPGTTACASQTTTTSKRKVQRRKANHTEIRYLFSYVEENPSSGKEFVRGFSIESFQQIVLQAKKNETYPKVLHPVTQNRVPDADLKRGEQMVKLLVQAGRLDQVEDEDPTTWTLDDIRGGPSSEVYPKLKKLSFSVFQSFFTKASIEVPDDAISNLTLKDLKALAKETKGMFLRNFEPSQRRQLCPESNGAAFCDLPYWEHDPPAWIHFILSNIHYVTSANKAAPAHLVKMAMYVFTGAIATISPSVRDRYQDSFAMDFEFPPRAGDGNANMNNAMTNSTSNAGAGNANHHEDEDDDELFAPAEEHHDHDGME